MLRKATTSLIKARASVQPSRIIYAALACQSKRSFVTTRAQFQEDEEQVEKAPKMTITDPFQKISETPFNEAAASVLMTPIEIRPDGNIYLPEIKYRRILIKAFGPGGWALMPKGKYQLENKFICQEYALFVKGQYVSQAWGEMAYDSEKSSTPAYRAIATALEGAKSNALMRCCKDVGIASELWDPNYILRWKEKYAVEVFCETKMGQKKKLWRRKDRPAFEYPYRETPSFGAASKKNVTTTSAVKREPEPLSNDADLFDVPVDAVQQDIVLVEETETNVAPKPAPVQAPTPAAAPSKPEIKDEEQYMFASLMDENPASENAPAAATSDNGAPKKQRGFSPNGIITFGKYKGKKWTDLIREKGVKSYLVYIRNTTESKSLRETVEQAMEWLDKQSK